MEIGRYTGADQQGEDDDPGNHRVENDPDRVVVPMDAVVGRATISAADGVDDSGSNQAAPPGPVNASRIGGATVWTIGILAAPTTSASARTVVFVLVITSTWAVVLIPVGTSAWAVVLVLVAAARADICIASAGGRVLVAADSVVLAAPGPVVILRRGETFAFARSVGSRTADGHGQHPLTFRAAHLPADMVVGRGQFVGTGGTGKVEHVLAPYGLRFALLQETSRFRPGSGLPGEQQGKAANESGTDEPSSLSWRGSTRRSANPCTASV
jgi:hypothetical protein